MSISVPDHMRSWLADQINLAAFSIESIIPEASTRQFWRLRSSTSSVIGILSPPATENNQQYCLLSDTFRAEQVPVPEVYAKDLEQGYLLVSDVGEHDIRDSYASSLQDCVIEGALEILTRIQRIQSDGIPAYTTDRLRMELEIFEEWICTRLLNVESKPMRAASRHLIENMNEQPKTTVHRDYHCRNLLFSAPDQFGVVDFQDALFGPAFYDLASLLYDCYYEFTPREVERYIQHFIDLQVEQDLEYENDPNLVASGVEYCAIQRQLKAVGIFCRLAYVQKKTTHLDFIVPVLTRTVKLCSQHQDLVELGEWLQTDIVPQVILALPKLVKAT